MRGGDSQAFATIRAENERRERLGTLNGGRTEAVTPQPGWQPMRDQEGKLSEWKTGEGKQVPAVRTATPAPVVGKGRN